MEILQAFLGLHSAVYFQMPTSEEEWMKIAMEYDKKWNFPHCLGSMDGKHVMIQAPINSGSDFFNYKGFFSIVLFAIVDAAYCFTYIAVGCQGRLSDGGVFEHTTFKEMMEKSRLNTPKPRNLPGGKYPVPFVQIADDAFPLKPWIMKPYAGTHDKGTDKRIFNYRLSRGRRVVENAFGILSVVFRVLRKLMLLEPEKAEKIVLTATYLHNFLRRSDTSNATYTPPGTFDVEHPTTHDLTPGQWRIDGMPEGTLLRLKRVPRKASVLASEIRQELTRYFTSIEGSVSWQNDYA